MISPIKDSPQQSQYIGRFAPSPSGPLHFGSLVCALASYLHAKQHQGKWLVRIEDIDTPRVDANMNDVILTSLQAHHLVWDDEVVYQSQRHRLYQKTLQQLNAHNMLYGCACSRRQIKARNAVYDGHCRHANLPLASESNDYSTRFINQNNTACFYDLHLQHQHITSAIASEDPVLQRKDGVYAYHLAVVADDIEQHVSHIVRGIDLLDTTPIHLALYKALQHTPPQYMHIPVVVQKPSEKLSKQHHSPAVDNASALPNLKLALRYLGIGFAGSLNNKTHKNHNVLVKTEATVTIKNDLQQLQSMLKIDNINDLLIWAIEHWTSNLLPKQTETLICVANGVYSWPNTHNEVKV